MSTPKPLHIFKPGTWTSMAGEAITFTKADLEATARAYDPKLHKAPLVIGHPRTDDPAQGWAKSLSVLPRGLYAEPMKVAAVFAEDVNAGRWGTISAKFYRPDDANNPVPGVWYLRHIGFLGAQPPAVKGMDEPAFAEDDGCVCFQEGVAFADWGMETNASLWRRMREWLLAKFDQETADQVVPDWQIESIREAARQEDAPRTAFADPTDIPGSPTQTTEEERHVTPEEKAALEAENAQLKQKLAKIEAEKQAAEDAKRHRDSGAFAEDLISKGLLAPKHKGAVVALLDLAAKPGTDGQPTEFSEGGTTQPLATAFKSFLGDMPKVVEFGETATKDKSGKGGDANVAEFAEKSTDPDRLNLHVRATELAAEKGIPYEQAVRQLL